MPPRSTSRRYGGAKIDRRRRGVREAGERRGFNSRRAPRATGRPGGRPLPKTHVATSPCLSGRAERGQRIDASRVYGPLFPLLTGGAIPAGLAPFDLSLDLKKFTDFITNGIVARRSVIEKDKDTVIRVIKVTAEAIKLIQTDKDYTKKVIMKWMPMKDPDLLEQAYLFASENYAKEGLVNEGALRSMVKQMVQSSLIDPKLAGSTPITAYYDNRYVEEVKRSGFFDQLWK